MGTLGFEKLEVYQVSEQLADQIWEIVSAWPQLPQDTVGKQMVRSADSIGATIAEGTGRGSFKDNRRFVCTARASLYETHHWLRRAFRRKLITRLQTGSLKPLLDELRPRLNACLKSIGPSTANTKDKGQRTEDNGQRKQRQG